MCSLALALALAGCASTPVQQSSRFDDAAPTVAPAASVVNLQFANGSSKASLAIDLSNTDVQLDMRTQPKKDSTQPGRGPSRDSSAARTSALPGTSADSPRVSKEATDSVTRAVVSGIRRGQDLFLKGDMAKAKSAVDATLAMRPTAEAYALAGSIAWVRGDKELARAHWQASLALDPAQPGVSDMLARTETTTGFDAGKAAPR